MNTTVKHLASAMAVSGALFCTVGAAQSTTTTTTTPKFTEVTSTIYKETGNVKVCFKATGLPIKATTFTAKGTVTATYACRNRGGNCPPGQDMTIKQTVAVSVTHTPDKNGSVSACIWLKVPKADKSTCPDEMALVLKSVSWSGISISDMPNSIGTVYATPSKQMVNYGSCPAR